MSTQDFWPTDIGDSSLVTPLSILKEQAALLGPKTRGLVTADVVSTNSGDNFSHTLVLIAPALAYRYNLLVLIHPISLYPVTGYYQGAGIGLDSEAELRQWLKEKLSGADTKRIVSALIAQSR